MSKTNPNAIYVINQYGPAEEIDLTQVGPVQPDGTRADNFAYARIRLLEAINDALQDIAATLKLNREDALERERNLPARAREMAQEMAKHARKSTNGGI